MLCAKATHTVQQGKQNSVAYINDANTHDFFCIIAFASANWMGIYTESLLLEMLFTHFSGFWDITKHCLHTMEHILG